MSERFSIEYKQFLINKFAAKYRNTIQIRVGCSDKDCSRSIVVPASSVRTFNQTHCSRCNIADELASK